MMAQIAVQDHGGDELLGELIGAVVVRTVREGDGKAVGVVVGTHEVVRGSFGGEIGAPRGVGSSFGEKPFRTEQAVDFVGAHVMKEHIAPLLPGRARRLL